jgi:Transposase DDE domain group 1
MEVLLTRQDGLAEDPHLPRSRSTSGVNVTDWSRRLVVSADGEGVVSHAGLAVLRLLGDRSGLTGGLSRALASDRLLLHDRGRVLADVACAVAGGARAISDVRVLTDQQELFGPVASVPTVWRTLDEVAAGGQRSRDGITRAVNTARRWAWGQIEARHGSIPPVRIADRTLAGVVGIRLDATVTPAHSEKEGAEPNFKGFGHHPLLSYCDNTGEALAGMLRPGSAGSNTTTDHVTLLDAAIAALPAKHRRRLLVTVDGAGASHGLIAHLHELAAKPGRQLVYSVGWETAERERAALGQTPEQAWQIAIDPAGEPRQRRIADACADAGCGHRRCWIVEAQVAELTGLLRGHPAGDRLAGWPAGMRMFARRERPHPGAQLSLFEQADGWRYSLWVTNLPERTRGWRAQNAYIDAAHRVHARVEDRVRTGKDTGLSRFPSYSFAINSAWLQAALLAATLLSCLAHLALDGQLAKAEPKTLRYRVLHTAARLTSSGRYRHLRFPRNWPWAAQIALAWTRIAALPQAP